MHGVCIINVFYTLQVIIYIMPLDLETRLELVKLYYKNNENAAATMRAYKKIKAMRKNPFPLSTLTRLIKKFESTKTLHDLPSRGRPSLEENRVGAVVEHKFACILTHPVYTSKNMSLRCKYLNLNVMKYIKLESFYIK